MMTSETVVNLSVQALSITAVVAAPLLLVVLAVGLIISIFQAATQINEQTLSFVPKLLAAVVVLALASPWMLQTLVEYTQRLISDIPQIIG